MLYERSMKEAARLAAEATGKVIKAYKDGMFAQEVPITGGLAMALELSLNETIKGISWKARVLESSSGSAGEENETGADLLIHVRFKAPRRNYSKGVLVQAKRHEPKHPMPTGEYRRLMEQCRKMVEITDEAYIFDYSEDAMRCGSAGHIAESLNRDLYAQCEMSAFDFFFDLFRCEIGDHRIRSTKVSELPVPTKVVITASRDRDT